MRHRLRLGALVVSLCACDAAPPELCGTIPDGGCPVGRGGTCEDAACGALYDCVEGSWVLTETCSSSNDGGGGEAGASSAGGGGEGGCATVSFDRTHEVTGCMPDFESPDCPAAAAETCAPCLNDCVDFFLCLEPDAPSWTLVAFCNDAGELVMGDRGP